jgi:DNA repair exonuclease SbcCD ATPase subunit
LEESRVQLENVVEYEAKIRAVDAIQNRYGEYEQQLRENTLRLLEYQTYNYFRRLTDQQAYAGCHIDRERYTLEVQPVGSNRLMQAWLTGGGHESLFALAERLALLRVMGFPHLLILDEPTDAVDSENVPQLLEYIARSSGEIGQILLVTHHGHGEEEGINLIRVRKVGGESRVSQDI